MSDGERRDGRSWLERALGVVTEVRAGEGITAVLLTTNIFILLTAYYVIKPVREALIGAMKGGAEYASYASAFIAITLVFAVPLYGAFASSVRRNRLVVTVTLFFASHLVIFYLASAFEVVRSYIGIVFFVWVGIFNMMVVAQFWAFANDLYSEARGQRLFPLIGIGASVGAAVGSGFSEVLVSRFGVYPMLPLAAALLSLCAVLTQIVHVRETRRSRRADSEGASPEDADSGSARPSDEGKIGGPAERARGSALLRFLRPFSVLFEHRYLTYIAAFALLFTLVNSNGEYMLRYLVNEAARERVGAGMTEEQFIGRFWAQFYFYVNVLGVILQSFVVSRLIKYLGLPFTFFILPAIALANASAVALVPVLAILRIGKIAENATDYSINNTVRNMLWLPTTREMKYNAKQAVDTFFVRLGDVSNAAVVFIGAELLSWSVRSFALTNIVLIVFWVLVGIGIFRHMGRMREVKEQLEGRSAAS